jgi:hypothetical protein
MPLPRWIEPQLCKLATKALSGAQWAHEIKLDGYRMAARIKDGREKLLTRSGHDWTAKVITETSKLDIRTGPRSVTPLNFRLTASLKLSWRTFGAVATTAFSAGTDELKWGMREGLVGGRDGERRSEERCSETPDTVHERFYSFNRATDSKPTGTS